MWFYAYVEQSAPANTRRKRKPFAEWKIKLRDQWREYSRPGNGLLKTEEEVAAALGEEPRTIRTWRHAGIIPSVVLGRRTIRFRLADVIRALERRTVKEV